MFLVVVLFLVLVAQGYCDEDLGAISFQQDISVPENFTLSTSKDGLMPGTEPKETTIELRINDKLTGLHALYEQQLKRLEALEYKITRMEVTQQERSEGLRSDMRELSRRVQNLDWMTTKTESTTDQIRTDIENIRLSLEGKRPANIKQFQSTDMSQRIEAIFKIASSTKNTVQQIETDLLYSYNNISVILNATKEIQIAQRGVPTKQFLNNAILGLKSQPIYVTMAPPNPHHELDSFPASCDEMSKSGLYKIQVGPSKQPFFVQCELINEVPWMVMQAREDGSVNFYKNWLDYVNGFGNLNGEFWLGLEKLHAITTLNIQKMLVILEDFDGAEKRAEYSEFAIASEKEHFSISILGTYNGTAGDSFTYHAGHKFSTFDLDNDGWKEGNCAQAHQGGWWYNACDMSNLNGRYLKADIPTQQANKGIYWNDFRGNLYSLKSVKMLIRPAYQG